MKTSEYLGLAAVMFGASYFTREYQLSARGTVNQPQAFAAVVATTPARSAVIVAVTLAGIYCAKDVGALPVAVAALGGAALDVVAMKQGWF